MFSRLGLCALAALIGLGALVTGCAAKTIGSRAVAAHSSCHGVTFDQVSGPRPALAKPPLLPYDVSPAVCAAYWIKQVDDGFVPQSLAVAGGTAYVSGYKWARRPRDRACQLAVVDLRTGATRAFVPRFEAPVYHPQPTFCRHGGGLELNADGLWVAERSRLWLLDPSRLGRGDPVKRVWRLGPRLRGSTIVIDHGRLGLGSWRPHRPGRVAWMHLGRILAPGVTELDRPYAARRDPVNLQGLTIGVGGLWFNSSSTHCAALKAPGRSARAFVPGSEDIQLVGADLWTVSEAGAKNYLDTDEQIVPMLLRLDRRAVLAAPPAHCAW
ncbi:MAG TPA: hypothetical protein VHZ06_00010 [Marmoricola sp.]|jgi:hypothetical protein|nr:hypothetical protein [Marmoricola sp.]